MRKVFSTPAKITQYFGENPAHYAKYDLNGHDGVDLVPTDPEDKRIYAVDSGEIIAVYESSTYGLTVKIYNKYTQSYIRYAHLSQLFVKVGETIYNGALIGILGDTGIVTGPHLHMHIVPAEPDTYEKKHPENGYKGRMDILPFLEMDDII